jgi:hypothetical protein
LAGTDDFHVVRNFLFPTSSTAQKDGDDMEVVPTSSSSAEPKVAVEQIPAMA